MNANSLRPVKLRATRNPEIAAKLGEHQAQSIRLSSGPKDVLPRELAILLSQKDKEALVECEEVLRRGLGTFFEVGNALLTIHDNELYRSTHATFEAYCRERWGIGRTCAWRFIGAAERLNLLPEDTNSPRPTNEFQMRPFLKIRPEEFPRAWDQVARKAKDGRITSALVRSVLRELSLEFGPGTQLSPPRKHKRNARRAPLGQILALLNQAKRAIEKHDTDYALAALVRIESLLFGPRD